MSLKNRANKQKDQGVWEPERQKALQTQRILWILIGAIAFLAIVVVGAGGSRVYPVIVAAINATTAPSPTTIVEAATETPTVPTPAPTTPVPTATTSVPISESPTATPTETWTPIPAPPTATPTNTPSATTSPTPTETATEMPPPNLVLGKITVNGAQVNSLPQGNTPVGTFEFNGKQVTVLPQNAEVVLCAKNGSRYAVAEKTCTPKTILGWVTNTSIEVLSSIFPPELITPAVEP